MQTVQDMSKDLMFRLRLDAEDRKRLETVAAHYSASASTVVRILIKEKFDTIVREPQTKTFRDEHGLVLDQIVDWYGQKDEAVTLTQLADNLDASPTADYPKASFRRGFAGVLNDLREWGYLARRGGAYRPTGKKNPLR